jgi:hypothetical protein
MHLAMEVNRIKFSGCFMSVQKKSRQWFRWLGGIALVGVGLTGLGMVAMDQVARQLEPQIDRQWEAMNQKFPRTEPNATAKQLDKLMSQLGGMKSPEELTNYFNQQSDILSDQITPPPAKLVQLIKARRPELDAAIALLNQAEAPMWGFSAERRQTTAAPIPEGLKTSNTLQKWLLVDALAKTQQNNHTEAARSMNAVWQINQGLAQDPSLIGQLFKVIGVKQQAIVLRKMQNLPGDWVDRLAKWQRSDPDVTLAAFQMEQFILVRMLRQETPPSLLGYLLNPYWRASSADVALKSQELMPSLRNQNLCNYDPNQFIQTSKVSLAWWNYPGQLGAPSTLDDMFAISQWNMLGRSMLHLQLAQKVLQAKTIAKQQSQLPNTIPNIATSICPDAEWRYQKSADGQVTIDFPRQADIDTLRVKNPRDKLQHDLAPSSKTPTTPQKATKQSSQSTVSPKPSGKL